jgi:outer membrane protein assembly factor BamB
LALNGESGETVWETARKVRVSWASPILASIGGSMQLILSADPLVAAYDLNSGRELWSVDCMMGEVGPSPAFGEGLIFAANEYAALAAIRPGGTIAWQNNEYLPEVASPVTAGGLLYIATTYGVLACYDANTGEKQWEHEANAGFYASPVIADGKVFALDTEGVAHIFSNEREKNLIAEPELGEDAVATPAFANGRIYIRGERHLFCIGK